MNPARFDTAHDTRSPAMPRYLISFDDGAMDHIPDAAWPAVGEAAHAVLSEAKAAGVWIFGGGLQRQQARLFNQNPRLRDALDCDTLVSHRFSKGHA